MYKAEDLLLDRMVAIKFIPAYLTDNPVQKDRFINEAKALAALNHPNVATIYGIEESESESFIVMEYVDGCDLRKILTDHGSESGNYFMPIEKILQISLQVVEGMQAAHQKQIIHRDIKPENIMIGFQDRVKILDFGIAKITGKQSLTKIGTAVGTAAYMSPEQASGQQLDHRSDIWSFGVVLYEMITGRRPFDGDYEQSIVYSILHGQPDSIELYRQDVPENLRDIVYKSLSKNPDHRYQHCEELVAELRSSINHKGAAEETVSRKSGLGGGSSVFTVKKLNKKIKRYLNTLKNRSEISRGIIPVVLILFAVSFYIYYSNIQSNKPHGKKIAVLPFMNMSKDPNDEYFSDGIMEDILTELVKISDLKVISRTTMMRYKNTNKTLSEISEELNSDVVLEGSVRRDSNNLRITVQLIDSKTDEHIWADTYDEKPERVFIIQSKIALKIASTLQAELSADEKTRIENSKVYNPEVYNLILKGRYFVNKLDSLSVVKAIELFSKALAIDPENASVLSFLANAYIVQTEMGYINLEDGYSKARNLVTKALDIDDDLAVPHTVLGMIKVAYDWDWRGAEKEFQKAIKIEPGNTSTLNQMGQLARTFGNIDEAIILMQRTIELEPVDIINYLYLAHFQMYANRLDDAVGTIKKGLELNPHFPYLHYILGCTYMLKKEPDKALIEINKEPVEAYRFYLLPMLYNDLGRYKEADSTLKDCIAKYKDIGSYNIAEIFAYNGRIDLAFVWLEKAYESRDGSLPYIKGDPFLKNIVNDPRYNSFLEKMNL